MTYFVLLILGLSIGAVFLTVLLIGDRREARRSSEKEALLEEIKRASQLKEGVWPPPPDVSDLPVTSAPLRTTKQLPPGTSRKMVYEFFRYRNYALGTIFVAYFVYSCYPKLSFGWTLLATAAGFAVLAIVMTRIQKSRRGKVSQARGIQGK
jgi:hypothetical protein